MARPSRWDSSRPENSAERLGPVDTGPPLLSNFGSIHSPELRAHQAADLEISSTNYPRGSGHSAGRVSSPRPLCRREEFAPRACGTWVRPCIHSIEAPLSRAELAAKVLPEDSGLGSPFERVSLCIPRQCSLNNLDWLSVNDRVGRVEDDLIARLDAGDDLNLIAEIVPSNDWREHDLSVFHNANM